MTAAQQYAKALHPDTYYVLGRRLRDYTLGHALLLERLGSPFVVPRNERPGRGDVKLFVAVCSRPYAKAVRLVASGKIVRKLRWVRCSTYRVIEGSLQIADYIAKSSHMPARWQNDEKGPEMGTPPLQFVKLTLIAKLHKSEEEALNMHLALAFWDCLGAWEMLGKTRLVDPETLEAVKAATNEAQREADQSMGA